MATWHPGAGSWSEYLQNEAFVEDIVGSIDSNATAVGRGIDAGVERLRGDLGARMGDISASIESLGAAFDYKLALLVQQSRLANDQLSGLIDRFDSIQRTLDSPMLTQAREYYRVACLQASKGLLDKALAMLQRAESIYDADSFTQYHLGCLYLFGVNADCNVIDLDKARVHLLLAARYAKAEIPADREFSDLAAESFLLASIAIYGGLGSGAGAVGVHHDTDQLHEAQRLAIAAAEINPRLGEAWYHAAKYDALLGESASGIEHFLRALDVDPSYAEKVHGDPAFAGLLPALQDAMNSAVLAKSTETSEAHRVASLLMEDIAKWMHGTPGKHRTLHCRVEEAYRAGEALAGSASIADSVKARKMFAEAIELGHELIEKRRPEAEWSVGFGVRDISGWTYLRSYSWDTDDIRALRKRIEAMLREVEAELGKGIRSADVYLSLEAKLKQAMNDYQTLRSISEEPEAAYQQAKALSTGTESVRNAAKAANPRGASGEWRYAWLGVLVLAVAVIGFFVVLTVRD